MPEDRSLDEFEGSDSGSADADADDSDPPDADDSDPPDADDSDPPDADEPIPAASTATWTTGGADCERCGDRVERRWLDDGDRVCPDCKSW